MQQVDEAWGLIERIDATKITAGGIDIEPA
jgi:hypothetical protein